MGQVRMNSLPEKCTIFWYAIYRQFMRKTYQYVTLSTDSSANRPNESCAQSVHYHTQFLTETFYSVLYSID